jgi:hypothetical protein
MPNISTWQTYNKTIFGMPDHGFEGVDQGYDPCAEPRGRVLDSMDISYKNGQLTQRDGYTKNSTWNSSSLMAMARLEFDGIDGIAVQFGIGEVRMLQDV